MEIRENREKEYGYGVICEAGVMVDGADELKVMFVLRCLTERQDPGSGFWGRNF